MSSRLDLQDVVLADNSVFSRARRGGAIYNAGSLQTRSGTRFLRNDATSGAAIYHTGTDVHSQLGSSSFEDNGGASDSIIHVHDGAQLEIVDSILRDNGSHSATVVNRGILTLDGSTFTGNSGMNAGSVFSLSGSVTARRSTFSGESARNAGAIRCGGSADTVVFEDATVFGNSAETGFGVQADDSCVLTFTNSLVAANSPQDCGYITTPTTSGVNVDSDGSCAGFTTAADSRVGPLADNGGATPTHLPQDASPLIDAGGAMCLGSDQRGQSRPLGAGCDIGAVEAR